MGCDFVKLPIGKDGVFYVNRNHVIWAEAKDEESGTTYLRTTNDGRPRVRLSIGEVLRKLENGCDGCGYRVHSQAVMRMKDCKNCGRRLDCDIEPEDGSVRINCYKWTPYKLRVPEVSDDDVR